MAAQGDPRGNQPIDERSEEGNVVGRAGSAHAAVLPLPPKTLREDCGEIPSRGRLGKACVVRDPQEPAITLTP